MKVLIKNELYKMKSRKLLWIILIFLIVFAIASIIAQYQPNYSDNWKSELNQENKNYETQLTIDNIHPILKKDIENKKKINEYRIKNNIPPVKENVFEDMLKTSGLIEFVIIGMIILSSDIVSSEFSNKTIKFLLIRPYHRWQFIISKFISLIIISTILLIIIGVVTLITSMIANQFNFESTNLFINQNNEIYNGNLLKLTLQFYGSSLVSIIFYVSLGLMISTLLRSSMLAVGLSLLIMITSNSLVALSEKIDILKYTPVPNIDMSSFIYHLNLNDDINIVFAILTLFIYVIVFIIISIIYFEKKDVTR
ncbi:hypothetical protein BHU61_10520 [Macrococcus epidermidis]|uniref:ABC transporter permease n=1 Tax=Macrococcus epidermidis TaxID=1902580 RepID=A0A327ZNU6_9STAP|nr:ABC transporter permease subunit [Macrococcus epidermidis]RAK43979.1 hypothetical protein BHU61_10520 [Macrococcus epidermidis]